MKSGVKVWKLPKIKGIISRILEVTTITLHTIFGSTFLGSPYCGELPFRELFGIYQDSGTENATTNSRLKVFSVACSAGSALHSIFFMQFDRTPCKFYYKKSDFKSTIFAKLLCCKNAAFCRTFCFAAMHDDVKNACIGKTRTEPEILRGAMILCLAIMIMRKKRKIPTPNFARSSN